VIKLEINTNIGSKALGVAGRLATPLGVVNGWMSAPTGGQGFGGLDQVPDFLVDRLSGWKIANPIITTQIALGQPDSYPIMSGLQSALLGWGIELVGDAAGFSAMKRAGSAFKRFGASSATNAMIAAWVYEAKNNPHGIPGGQTAGGVVTYSKNPVGVDVDNPQGLAPMYMGGYTSSSFASNL